MIGLGVISQAGGQGFIVWALAHLSASFSSAALLSAPVAPAVFVWIFLSETMGKTEIAGILAMLVDISMAHRASRVIGHAGRGRCRFQRQRKIVGGAEF